VLAIGIATGADQPPHALPHATKTTNNVTRTCLIIPLSIFLLLSFCSSHFSAFPFSRKSVCLSLAKTVDAQTETTAPIPKITSFHAILRLS
jgi:hypothetical protein